MAEEYERRGPLGEDDGPGVGGEVRERGLFGGHHHGRRSDYLDEAGAYSSEFGGPGAYGRRPGSMAYEGEPGYGRPVPMAYGEPGYERPVPMAYGEPGYERPYGEPGYGRQGAMYEGAPGYGGRQPEVVYVEGDGYGGYGRRPEYYGAPAGEVSDLGTGLMDSNIRTRPDYGSSLMRPDMAGVPVGAYEGRGHHGHGHRTEEEFEEERRHKRFAEAAAAAAVGYGLHERHEKSEAEERLEELGYDSDGRRKHERHGIFRSRSSSDSD